MKTIFILCQHLYYRLFPPVEIKDTHGILNRQLPYYQKLNPLAQKRFRERLAILLKLKNFKPAAGLSAITDEMRIVIGGGIIQLTFGLRSYSFHFFRTIYVTPHSYRYGNLTERFLGHVDLDEQVMVLSWADVLHGFRIPDDSLNVVLHECAHVLEAEDEMRMMFSKFVTIWHWLKWEYRGKKKLKIIQREENRFLKNYGGKNMKELFAVSVEAFFEQPRHFQKELPELYQLFCKMLKQDPLRNSDPRM